MKGKLIYTKQLGKSVALQAQSAKMGKLHVIAGDSNWKVVSEGSVKALRVFSTVEKAIDFAKNVTLGICALPYMNLIFPLNYMNAFNNPNWHNQPPKQKHSIRH